TRRDKQACAQPGQQRSGPRIYEHGRRARCTMGAVTDYEIATDDILTRHRQLGGLKALASSAQKLADRSFELYGPTNIADFAKWLGRAGNLAAKPQLVQVVQANQQHILTHGDD